MAKKFKSYRRKKLPNGVFDVQKFDTEHPENKYDAPTVDKKSVSETDNKEETVAKARAAAAEEKAAAERVVKAKAAEAKATADEAAVKAEEKVPPEKIREAEAASAKAKEAVKAAEEKAKEAKAASDKAAAAVVAAALPANHEENLKDALAFHLMQEVFKDKPGDVRVSFISDQNEVNKTIDDLKRRMKYGKPPEAAIEVGTNEAPRVKDKPFYFEVKTISFGFQTIHMKGWRDKDGKEGVLIADPTFIGEAIKYAALRGWDSLKFQQPPQDIDRYKKSFFPSPGWLPKYYQSTKAYYNLKKLINELQTHNNSNPHKVGFDLPFGGSDKNLQDVFGFGSVTIQGGVGERPAWEMAKEAIEGYRMGHPQEGKLLYKGETRTAKPKPVPVPEPGHEQHGQGLKAEPISPSATRPDEQKSQVPPPASSSSPSTLSSSAATTTSSSSRTGTSARATDTDTKDDSGGPPRPVSPSLSSSSSH